MQHYQWAISKWLQTGVIRGSLPLVQSMQLTLSPAALGHLTPEPTLSLIASVPEEKNVVEIQFIAFLRLPADQRLRTRGQ